MGRIVFNEVSIVGEKSGKCSCGKRTKRRKKFYQTLNPFNVDKRGVPKTRDVIWGEINGQLLAWENAPVKCSECEP